MSADITAAVLAAYLKCPTKAYLMARGEKPPDTLFADIRGRISTAYKASARQRLRTEALSASTVDFARLADYPVRNGATLLVDCETASYAFGRRPFAGVFSRPKPSKPDYVPILYSAFDKSDKSDELCVCLGALAIAQVTGNEIPSTGKIIYGEEFRGKTIRVADQIQKTQQLVDAIASVCYGTEPPALILNKHCPTCDFQSRCRSLAVKADNLSLLGAMTMKERAKCEEKGITTITQLSYGYRPRRRRRIKLTGPRSGTPAKHDHKLKALAIKKAQIHIVGSPSLSSEGTPVFMDVEGMPGRDFYYLVGLRHETLSTYVEQSFWAEGPDGEREMWWECLRFLKAVENPRIVHYGAYESRFLKRMRERWKVTGQDAEFVDRLVDGSLNLLASIYGKIYFPTYSNGLKEIARWLGFEWTLPQASGGTAMLLRRCWELTSDETLRRELIRYNIEDCRAANFVAEAISRMCGNSKSDKLESVDVSSLEVGFQRTFGKFPSALPEFEKINTAAYWDYQRSKIYIRTNKIIRRSFERIAKSIHRKTVEKEFKINDELGSCARCGASKWWRLQNNRSYIVFDLKFTRRGIKRWAVRYRYHGYRCSTRGAERTIHVRESKYGANLRAYVTYLLIEMRLSHQKIAEHIATVFHVRIPTTSANEIKSAMAQKYEPTYRSILEQIVSGPLVHADETKGVVYGGGHYIWIFANLTFVAYVYSASREASILNDILARFKGVLVSDFYAGYDAVPCRQQKCLIHLMRDINEDVLKHPFNEELTFIAGRFGTLMREIVETIDRHGLKRRHLRKHSDSVEQFLDEIATLRCVTEVGSSLKKRIDRNRDKLFTFLDCDNVPWNNNNAEHAVRAFTRLRNVMNTSTPKGTSEYCILLTLQQTLRYRGMDFLDFLRSGRTEIDR